MAQHGRDALCVTEQAACSEQRAIAAQRADQVGFIRQMLRRAEADGLVVCVYGERKVLVQLGSRLRLEDNID
jgi:hypothetical protein